MTPKECKQQIRKENKALRLEFPELRNKKHIEFNDIERAIKSQLAKLKAKLERKIYTFETKLACYDETLILLKKVQNENK